MMTRQPVAVIGLGKLGLALAARLLEQRFQVYGYDAAVGVREELHTALRAFREGSPLANPIGYGEPDVHNTVATFHANFVITDTAEQAAEKADVISIIVPTPSRVDGAFSTEAVERVLTEIAPAIQRSLWWKVVNVVSTVMPSACDSVLVPLLETLTGKRCGPPVEDDSSGRETFGFTYNPEFIALGRVLKDLRTAPFVLVGAREPCAAAATATLHLATAAYGEPFGGFPPKLHVVEAVLAQAQVNERVRVTSFVDAEIAKLSLNYGLTLKLSFANAVGLLCNATPGADVDSVLRVVGSDLRIGSRYLKAGLGFGGPCLPRDVVAWHRAADAVGVDLTDPNDDDPEAATPFPTIVNASLREWPSGVAGAARKVVILGASYKPGTHVIEDSQSLALETALRVAGRTDVVFYDPAVPALHGGMKAFVDADVVIVATDDPKWRKLPWRDYIEDVLATPAIVMDYWRLLRDMTWRKAQYVAFGIGPTRKETSQ